MSKNTVGNVAIGLGVVVLGFVVYRTMGSSTATTTSAAPTAKQTSANNAIASLASGAGSSLLSWFNTSGSSSAGALSGVLGGATTTAQLDQTYSSTAYNPDQISSDIASDTTASMATAGESDVNTWGFSL